MSQIILARHAKVKIDNPLIYSSQMQKWIETYNYAPIDETEISHELQVLVENADILLTSKLSRTNETLKVFGKEPNYSHVIFNEAELPYSDLTLFRMPAKFWTVFFRAAWLLGYRSNSESYTEAKIRAGVAVDKLIEFSKQHKTVLLVGHGVMNRLIIKALQKRGVVLKEKTGDGNLSYSVLEATKN